MAPTAVLGWSTVARVLWNANMSLLAPLISRRVPVYVFFPIVVACGAVGFVASTMRPGNSVTDASRIHAPADPGQGSVATSAVTEPPLAVAEKQLPTEAAPPREAPFTALPADEMDLPVPVATPTPVTAPAAIVAHDARPDDARPEPQPEPQQLVTPPPEAKPPHRQARVARTARSVSDTSKTRRSQRSAQQRANPSTTSSAGLKNFPVLGPMFSLLQ